MGCSVGATFHAPGLAEGGWDAATPVRLARVLRWWLFCKEARGAGGARGGERCRERHVGRWERYGEKQRERLAAAVVLNKTAKKHVVL